MPNSVNDTGPLPTGNSDDPTITLKLGDLTSLFRKGDWSHEYLDTNHDTSKELQELRKANKRLMGEKNALEVRNVILTDMMRILTKHLEKSKSKNDNQALEAQVKSFRRAMKKLHQMKI